MIHFKHISVALLGGFAMLAPATAEAGSGYGFSFSTGGPAYYAPPPPPIYYAPPPPPVYYAPPVVYRPYYRPAPSFSFSYHGH